MHEVGLHRKIGIKINYILSFWGRVGIDEFFVISDGFSQAD